MEVLLRQHLLTGAWNQEATFQVSWLVQTMEHRWVGIWHNYKRRRIFHNITVVPIPLECFSPACLVHRRLGNASLQDPSTGAWGVVLQTCVPRRAARVQRRETHAERWPSVLPNSRGAWNVNIYPRYSHPPMAMVGARLVALFL